MGEGGGTRDGRGTSKLREAARKVVLAATFACGSFSRRKALVDPVAVYIYLSIHLSFRAYSSSSYFCFSALWVSHLVLLVEFVLHFEIAETWKLDFPFDCELLFHFSELLVNKWSSVYLISLSLSPNFLTLFTIMIVGPCVLAIPLSYQLHFSKLISIFLIAGYLD